MCKFKFRLIVALLTFGVGVLGVSLWIIKKTNHITTISDGSEPVLTETADNSQDIKSENRYPIIEIWQESKGSVPFRGTSLYFRMFDDGVVEFEYELHKLDLSGKPRWRHSFNRMLPTEISDEEFSRLKALVEDLNNRKDIKQEYKPVGLTLDVITKLTIHLNENGITKRKIIINDSDSAITYKQYEKKFPNWLINLIKEIQSMRARLQEKGQEQNKS